MRIASTHMPEMEKAVQIEPTREKRGLQQVFAFFLHLFLCLTSKSYFKIRIRHEVYFLLLLLSPSCPREEVSARRDFDAI